MGSILPETGILTIANPQPTTVPFRSWPAHKSPVPDG